MANANMLTRVPKDAIVEVPPRYVNVSRLEQESNSGVEWHHIQRILRRHWRPSLAFALGLELILLLVVLFLQTSYQSTATLEISPVVSENVGLHDTSPITPTQQDYLDTQSEILRSDYLALKVIRDLNLDRNPTFYSPSLLGRAIQRGVQRLKVVWSGSSKAASDEERTDGLLQTFRTGLSVNQVKNSRLVDVSFESRNAQLSTLIVNDLVRLYLDDAHRSKYDSTLKAAESLAPELTDLKNSVDKSNRALSDFQATHVGAELAGGLPQTGDPTADSMGQAMSSNPVAVRVAQLNQQLTQSMGDRMQQESNIKLIQENHYDVLPQMKDSPLIQELTQKRVDSRAQLAQALAIYGSNNPVVRKLARQTDELNNQLNAERQRIVEQIRSSYKSAKVREDLLRKSLRDLKGQLDSSNADAVRFDLLRREAQAQSNLYIATSARIKELAVSGSLAANNIRELGDARVPYKPSGPHSFQILGAGLLLGMIGGVVLAFVSEGMDDKISTLADVERISGMSALGLLPASQKRWRGTLSNGKGALGKASINGRSLPVLQFLKEKPNSPEAEAIRSLETAIRVSAQWKETPVKTLLITSGFPGEGKTTVATNLAAALSRHYKTCLIDADLRHPVITSTYGLKRQIGLQDALMKPELVDELSNKQVEAPSLTVLGSGAAIPDAIDKMTSDSMAKLLERLKTRFDYIVIDSPPVIPFAESRWLSALADGIVIVARASTTTRRALGWTMNILADVQPQVLGVVLNGVDISVDYDQYAKSYRYYRTIPA
ncbi:MAG TPA: polysaccharide biosynthesis tyrosine autokinase [Candidatus Acidoferrum sp.]|jgi:capsular exopolysaccharide synthesis family protein